MQSNSARCLGEPSILTLLPSCLLSVQQFLSAVKYCHSHCVAHRDLKLDNTLLDG